MSINFFELACKTESNKDLFGLCDDPPPATRPAYINEAEPIKWIAIVNNSNNKNASFYAIDHCVTILKSNGKDESRCDGLLTYSNDLIFIELKSREGGQWLKTGREQLTITINNFKIENDISTYDNVTAHVCNELRPLAHSGQATNIQKFKDDTGFILKGEREINI